MGLVSGASPQSRYSFGGGIRRSTAARGKLGDRFSNGAGHHCACQHGGSAHRVHICGGRQAPGTHPRCISAGMMRLGQHSTAPAGGRQSRQATLPTRVLWQVWYQPTVGWPWILRPGGSFQPHLCSVSTSAPELLAAWARPGPILPLAILQHHVDRDLGQGHCMQCIQVLHESQMAGWPEATCARVMREQRLGPLP